MRSFFSITLLFLSFFCFEKEVFSLKKQLFSEAETYFDPFIDYGEFQDQVTEEESIIFFQNGRSLNLSFLLGYEALSFNMAQVYGDSPFIAGLGINFFIDLHLAFQVRTAFPYRHYNSLFGTGTDFFHFGMDLKYYLNKQYSKKEKDVLNPYVSIGSFFINITDHPSFSVSNASNQENESALSSLEREALSSLKGFGAKFAIGFEIALIKQSFVGIELAYLYTNLQFEGQDLSNLSLPQLIPSPGHPNPFLNYFTRRQYPSRPVLNRGYRFYGDLIDFLILFGVNF